MGTKSRYWNPVLSNQNQRSPSPHNSAPSVHTPRSLGKQEGPPHLQSGSEPAPYGQELLTSVTQSRGDSGVSRSKAWVSPSTSYPSTSSDFLAFNSLVSALGLVFQEGEPWAPGDWVGEGDPLEFREPQTRVPAAPTPSPQRPHPYTSENV